MSEGEKRWTIYILRCGDGSLYTGIATDVVRRISEHESGRRGSRYLRGRGPLELIFQWHVEDRSVASRAERRIKSLSRKEKEVLVSVPGCAAELLDYRGSGKRSTG